MLGISGTITGSKIRVVLNKLLEDVKSYDPTVDIEVLDLKKYNVQFCDGRDPSTYEGDTKKAIDTGLQRSAALTKNCIPSEGEW